MDVPFLLELESDAGSAAAPGAEALAATSALPEKDALAAFRRAVHLEPGDPDYFFIFGGALAQLGRHKEAVASYREALRLQASDAAYHRALGVSLWKLGLFEEALASFRESLSLQPEDVEAQNGLAVSVLCLGRAKDAVQVLRQLVRGDRSRADLHSNLGAALWSAGSQGEAERAFREAVRASPAYAPYRRNLGIALTAQGRHAEAAECFREVLKRHPEDAAAFMDLGDALFALGRHPEAEAAYEEGSLLDPALAASRVGSREARQAIVLDRARAELRSQSPASAGAGQVFWRGVSSLEDAVERRPGRLGGVHLGRAQGVVLVAFLIVAARAVFVLLPPYVTHFRFRDDVAQLARNPSRDDASVRERLRVAVERHKLTRLLNADDCRLETHASVRTVGCRYAVPVSVLPGITTTLHFEVLVAEPFLVEPDPIIL